MLIRSLNKDLDLGFVFKFYEEAPDYLESAERPKPRLEKVISFFTDIASQTDHFVLGFFWMTVCRDWQNYPLGFLKLAIHI